MNMADRMDNDDIKGFDRRLTVLETRFDTILPTLATKADLSELKADLHQEIAGLHKWIAATCIALILGFGALTLSTVSTNQKLERLTTMQQQR